MSYFDDDKKRPLSDRLGDTSDKTFGFFLNPGTIKFGILIFAGLSAAIDLWGYHQLMQQSLSFRVDQYGQEVAVSDHLGVQLINALTNIPLLGEGIRSLDIITGGLFALFFAIGAWFMVQGLELAGRFHLYFPEAAENLLYKQNRKNYEQPNQNNPNAKKAHRLATGHLSGLLRWLTVFGYLAYLVNAYILHLSRPWVDTVGNPLWQNWIFNVIALAGVELGLILHRAYKHMTLNKEEQAEKDRR
jgi:hypothetical protein